MGGVRLGERMPEPVMQRFMGIKTRGMIQNQHEVVDKAFVIFGNVVYVAM